MRLDEKGSGLTSTGRRERRGIVRVSRETIHIWWAASNEQQDGGVLEGLALWERQQSTETTQEGCEAFAKTRA